MDSLVARKPDCQMTGKRPVEYRRTCQKTGNLASKNAGIWLVDRVTDLGVALGSRVMKQIQQFIQQRRRRDSRAKKAIRYEFQAYAQRLAEDLQEGHKVTLYMKLAKEVDRALLEQAREHVLGSETVRNRGALFMFKLKELRNQKRESVSNKA